MEEKNLKGICERTGRLCVGGAYDGGDGWGIDCDASSPENCEFFSPTTSTSSEEVPVEEREEKCETCGRKKFYLAFGGDGEGSPLLDGMFCPHCEPEYF